MFGIGIDTGGTCTDAVIYEFETGTILASAKSATTHEKLERGIGRSLRKLPRAFIDQASYISLSTTLATNACVENKGGRVCLIFIGVPKKTLDEMWESYGFDGTAHMRFLDADVSKGIAPDWDAFEAMLPEILNAYDSIAVSQVMAKENGAAYEKEVRRRVQEKKNITVVCAYEIFQELNVIKRGAGAYLNARLIPVIEEFFDAVHHVLEEEQIPLPFLIMRSDGSLVSEQYAKTYPVETLLCGPTASTKGAASLMHEPQAIVIDMGGTTTDIALIKDGEAKTDCHGIKVGGWQTFVKGIEIDTFALGGDSHVAYENRHLLLREQRVMPLSMLASAYPQVLTVLEELAKRPCGSTKPLYDHLLLQKDPADRAGHYTERELFICQALKEGPLDITALAEAIGQDVYQLDTRRLEREGILLRSSFTPTDAMVIKGDHTGLEQPKIAMRAALAAAKFLAASVWLKAGDDNSEHGVCTVLADQVYQLVKEKLYCNLVRILWKDAHADDGHVQVPDALSLMAKEAFEAEQGVSENGAFFRNVFSTDATLLGVGAPTHVFLDDVAKALHTTGRISAYSGVSNALGALLGDACVYETVQVRTQSDISSWDEEWEGFIVYGEEKEIFESFDDACARAEEIADIRAREKIFVCGAKELTSITCTIKKKELQSSLCAIMRGADVTVCARGKFF